MASIRVPAKYENLAQISDFIVEAAHKAKLDEAAVYAVQLSVDEACSNIMEHAYEGKGEGDINCTCEIMKDGLRVILKDYGKPLNPEDVPDFDLDVPLEELETGGAGVYLMNQLMDQVYYASDPETGNRLVLVKRK
jgi:serine/threonine-protein kinase RsbW